MRGKLHKTAAGFNTYDVEEAEADLVFPVVSAIEKQFGYEVPRFGFSLGCPVVEMRRDDVKIIVSWDNWSGLFVMAVDSKGDDEIERIGAFLEDRLDAIASNQVG